MRPDTLGLQTDFYQITMAASYFDHQVTGRASFSMFAHDLPSQRGFMVAAGLEDCLDYLESFHLTNREIDYLHSLGRFKPEFLDMLSGLRFTGEVWAVPEGTVLFAGEPIVEVSAPLIEAQLVETLLINLINLNTTLASKAARCAVAAQGRTCVDFSLRRTQGPDAGFAAARSSAIVGFAGTSNVAAAMDLGLTPVGTMAHAFVEAFGDEIAAFRAFAKTFPTQAFLLVDTYDSLEGLHKAVELAKELEASGHRLLGVRLDSGDLAGMSRQARRILDQAGLSDAKVAVSGNLDENRIAALLEAGAEIDLFGVGTRMGSSADCPYLDFAYKLVSYQGRPTLKLSTGKETWVSSKQLWRTYDGDGLIAGDLLALRQEQHQGKPLLQPVMRGGRRLQERLTWREARELYNREVATLPAQCLAMEGPKPLMPLPSNALVELQERTRREALEMARG